jgi:hypothetical protein
MTTAHLDDTHRVDVRRRTGSTLGAEAGHWHFSWGAIFAGALVSIGIWLLLHILGLGIGLTAINPDDADSLRGIGMTTGIWSIIAPIIAMFVGGIAAARVAGPMPRLGAAIHGAVLWSLATLASAVLLVSVVSSLIGGITRIGAQAVSGAAQAVGSMDPAALGIGADDLLGPVNDQLRASGRPALSSEQLSAATRDALSTSVREGRLDRDVLVTALARNTSLSQADASQLAARMEQQYNQKTSALGNQMRDAGTQARGAVLQAAETTGKGMLGLFLALLLGLGSAVLGAMLGDSREQRLAAQVH